MNCLESEQYDLKLDTKLHREPMQFSQNRRYMTEPVEPTDKSSRSILHALKLIQLTFNISCRYGRKLIYQQSVLLMVGTTEISRCFDYISKPIKVFSAYLTRYFLLLVYYKDCTLKVFQRFLYFEISRTANFQRSQSFAICYGDKTEIQTEKTPNEFL